MHWLLKLAIISALLYLSCFVATDSTAQTWSAPINISNSAKDSVGPAIAIDSSGNLHVAWGDLVLGRPEIFYSRWDRKSWSNPVNISNTGFSGAPAIAVDNFGNPHVVWHAEISGNFEIFYSQWNGTNWSSPMNISNTVGYSAFPAIAIDASGNTHVAWEDRSLDSSAEIFYSRWNSANWSKPVSISNALGHSAFPAITIDAIGNLHVVWHELISRETSNDDIFYSRWNGINWSNPINISNNTGSSEYSSIAIDFSGNLHVVWSDFTPGTTNARIFYSQYLPFLERAYQLLQSSSNPSVEFELAKKLLERLISLATLSIKETKLLPNYPNPFNPETWIPYQLSESANVIIQIYDSTGRLVRILNIGRQSAGIYVSKERAAYWDGKNEIGETVASGVYYYSIKANGFRAIRRMTLLK